MRPLQKMLVFTIKGYMAHFRKFYSNSSSLTYSFPPRTTVTGMIAGILGRERDSYYEEFSSNNCSVAISIGAPHRKINQTVNFIRTKNKNELNGSAGPTQIPLEILMGEKNKVQFNIYFMHDKKEIIDELTTRIKENKYIYPPYLGITEFTAELEFIDIVAPSMLEIKNSKEVVKIDTVVNIDHLQEKGIVPGDSNLKILKEKMTSEFAPGREIKNVSSLIFEAFGKRLPVRLKKPYLAAEINGETRNITFMSGGI